jgi:hypothetical protein
MGDGDLRSIQHRDQARFDCISHCGPFSACPEVCLSGISIQNPLSSIIDYMKDTGLAVCSQPGNNCDDKAFRSMHELNRRRWTGQTMIDPDRPGHLPDYAPIPSK